MRKLAMIFWVAITVATTSGVSLMAIGTVERDISAIGTGLCICLVVLALAAAWRSK